MEHEKKGENVGARYKVSAKLVYPLSFSFDPPWYSEFFDRDYYWFRFV